MKRATTLGLLTFLLLTPAGALAQTLTVQIDATIDAPSEPAPPAPSSPRPDALEEDAPPPPPRPIVVVPPLESDPAPAPAAPVPAPYVPRVPPLAVVQVPAPAAAPEPEEDVLGWAAFGIWVEGMDLSGLDLELHDPEITALSGTQLGAGWVGGEPLRDVVAGGAMLGFGMRAARYVRGPELRLFFGGSDTEGPWAAVPGGPEGLELSVRSAFVVRVEAAFGLQIPLGPVTPYVLGRASAGAAFVDVAVRDARLGELGTETVDAALLELGLEAGLEVQPEEGLVLGFAFRGSFLGTPSYGGVFTIGYAGE